MEFFLDLRVSPPPPLPYVHVLVKARQPFNVLFFYWNNVTIDWHLRHVI